MAHNTNKGRKFPPDPLGTEDIALLLAACTPQIHGKYGQLVALRLKALIILLWRTGLRISEALDLESRDFIRQDYAVVVRSGKGGKRGISAMDAWAWGQLDQWTQARDELPIGPFFCVCRGPNCGKLALSGADARRQLRDAGQRAGLRKRVNPHNFRHTHAVELWREGIDTYCIQQQLRHARLDVTATYLRGLAPIEILEPIGHRKAPVVALSV